LGLLFVEDGRVVHVYGQVGLVEGLLLDFGCLHFYGQHARELHFAAFDAHEVGRVGHGLGHSHVFVDFLQLC